MNAVLAFATASISCLLRRRRSSCVTGSLKMSLSSGSTLPHIVNLVRRAVRESSRSTRPPFSFCSAASPRRTVGIPALTANDVDAILAALKALDSAELGVDRFSIARSGDEESDQLPPIGFCHVGGEEDLLEASIFLLPPNTAIPG
jgi:hypothetical protein